MILASDTSQFLEEHDNALDTTNVTKMVFLVKYEKIFNHRRRKTINLNLSKFPPKLLALILVQND